MTKVMDQLGLVTFEAFAETSGELREGVQHKRVEAERRKLADYLDTILLNLPVGVAIFEGPDFRYFRINQLLAEINGLPIGDHLGRPLADVLPDAAATILPGLDKVLQTGKSSPPREFSTRLPKNPQEVRHFIDFFFPIFGEDGEPRAVGAAVLDITERKQAEEALRLFAERLKILHEIDQAILASHSGWAIASAIVRRIHILIPCERVAISMFDFKAHEAEIIAIAERSESSIIAGTCISLEGFESILEQGRQGRAMHWSQLPSCDEMDAKYRAEGVRSYVSIPLIASGELIGAIDFWMSDSMDALSEEHESLAREIADQMAIAMQQARLRAAEVQRRKEAETLREVATALTSVSELPEMLDSILIQLERVVPYESTAIFLQQADDKLHIVACRGFLQPDKLMGLSVDIDENELFCELSTCLHPLTLPDARQDSRFQNLADIDYVRGWMGVPLIAHSQLLGYLTIDSRWVGAYGEAEARLAQAFANHAAIAIENARLVSDLESAQAELIQQERLAALGQMAATVAHELRNPLMALRMGVDYLVQDVHEGDPRSRGAALMQANMDRIERVVEDILFIGRAPEPNLHAGSLRALIEQEAARWEATLSEKEISLHLNLAVDLPPILLDQNQMGRAITNLIANSLDALPRGGELRLSLSQSDEIQVISLADNGPGISQAHLARIFEPFFTTKTRGTGLGLSIVKRVVEFHQGEISVWSELDAGTEFLIRLPARQ